MGRFRDDIEREVHEEFKSIVEKAKEIEEFFENSFKKFDKNLSREEVTEIKSALDELRALYREFLDVIYEHAGSVTSSKGKAAINRCRVIHEKLRNLDSLLDEIAGVIKPNINDEMILKIKSDYIAKWNEEIEELRKFFMEDIFDIIDNLERELEKQEVYYG